ncbi:hypothetical protein CMV_016532 [Castanea mollissima]|uniref:DUF7906 domain-containing protein n=1 Tax=Castanea mollissima TaxID=60419 RepID=A0A8J4QZI3_9ROSI|nr:hypothetical protein CMV_016532 [Castanea mollissima]
MPTTATTTPLLLLLLLLLTTTTSSSPILGLDSYLAQQSRQDPQATNDTFLTLPTSLKKSLSSPFPLPSIPSLTSSLLSFSVPLSLHIRLVGTFPPNSPSLLSSFLSSASQPLHHFHVISPFHPPFHSLSIQHTPHFDIAFSPPSLTSTLSESLSSQISKSPSSLRSSLLSIPFSSIDSIVSSDFRSENEHENRDGIFIYLINLGPQSKPYAYSYSDSDSSAGFTDCLGTIHASKNRYLWIDLAAGPVDYGPALSGDGVLPRGEFHPLAAFHSRQKSQKSLLADVSSLIWSAYQVLLVPSLRIPVPFENSLLVQFIHVRSGSARDSSSDALDWKKIERALSEDGGLLLRDQTLRFKNYEILSDSGQAFRSEAEMPVDNDFGRVLPVYVFDLDYNNHLLLDRYHQSVAFKDMVIAVRTRNTQTVSDYTCNGRHMFTQTRSLERPLVGSILQSMWGVSPTHLLWSPRHNSTLVDYTWSVGQTPFGPFSESLSLSFVQKDAAKRSVLLTMMNYSITSAIDFLEAIAEHGGDRKLLKQNQHLVFEQRWTLFKYKLDKAVSALSHLDFEMALYYLKSSDHDLRFASSLLCLFKKRQTVQKLVRGQKLVTYQKEILCDDGDELMMINM